MDTTKLIAELAQQKAAMTAQSNALRQAEAARRWLALGGSEAAFARVDAVHFMAMNETEQRRLVAEVDPK